MQVQPTAKCEATTKQVLCGAHYLNQSVSHALILLFARLQGSGKTVSLITF